MTKTGIFTDTQNLQTVMSDLFEQIRADDPNKIQSLHKSKMILSFKCDHPTLRITVNGRKVPIGVTFNDSHLRPDFEVVLSADALHYILTGELRLSKAMSTGQIKVNGPVWKAVTLEDVLHVCQSKYPDIVLKYHLDGHGQAS